MAESIRFDFLSTGAGRLARDFKNTGDTAAAAARGAKVLSEIIGTLGQKEGRTAAESSLLARALRQTGDAEDRAAAKAVTADAAIRRLDDAMQKNKRDALEAAAANRVLGDSFDKLARKAGGASLTGALAALSPALIPVTAGLAAGIGAVGTSFGAAAIGAGAFAALAKTALGQVSTAAAAYQKAQAKAAAAPATAPGATRAQLAAAKASLAAAHAAQVSAKGHAAQAAAQARVTAAQARLNQLEGQGAGISKQRAAALKAEQQALAGLTGPQRELVKSIIGIKTEWKDLSLSVATPVLAPWMSAASKALTHLRPLVQPVADEFKYWGESVDAYFGSQQGSAEVTRLAAAFGRFSASQLRDIGIFVVGIGKGIASLGRDLAGHNADFGTFGTHLAAWGTAFQRWSASSAARQDVSKFLAYIHANGPVAGDLLKNLGGALKVFAPGLSSLGSAELAAIRDFLGFIALLPASVAKPLIDVAGTLLLIKKTGIVTIGLKIGKITGTVAKWLTTGTIDIGGGAAAAGEMRAAFASGGAAAAAEMRAALAGGGVTAGAENAAGSAAAAAGGAGVAVEGAGASLAALLAPVVAGALGGLIIAAWVSQFRTAANQHPAPAAQTGARGFQPTADSVNAWKQYDKAVTSTAGHVSTLASIFATTGKAATSARAEVGTYTAAIVRNGLNSDQATASRARLVRDMTAAGISAGTARADVSAYGLAIDVNGARSDQARAARQRLNADIGKAIGNSQRGKTDLAALTAAVTRNGAQSDAARGARQRLISDLVRAGTDAGTARNDVNNLQTAISKMHGKGITITMGGKGYYTISEAGKNYQISAGGLFSPHAAGGFISGGVPGRDSVPGMLMPGEVVVPVPMVKAGAVDHLRGQLPGFASGGAVGPLRTGEAGIGRFYKADVNAEGYSLTTAMRTALKAAEAAARAASFAVSGSGPVGGDAAANKALARRMFPWPASMWPSYDYLEMREAGYNRFARNPSSGAYGIPQALPPTKMPFAAQAAGGSHAGPQLSWMYSYIRGRYGNPVSAAAHERAYNWYGKGGLVPGYASGGTVAGKGRAWLNAWQARHGGGFGAAWGPVVVNEQIARMQAAIGRAKSLSGAGGLSAGQHKFWAAAAADETKRLGVLKSELATERAWRYQLQLGELGLDKEIRAAGGLPSLAGPVKGWKAQLGRDRATVAAISKMLGYSDAYLAAHPAAKPGPVLPAITHTYGGDVADNLGTVLAAALGPFTGAARGGLVMDQGGTLRPGFNPVWNMTGRPESLVPARGGGGGQAVRVELDITGGDQELVTLLRKIVKVKGGGNARRARSEPVSGHAVRGRCGGRGHHE